MPVITTIAYAIDKKPETFAPGAKHSCCSALGKTYKTNQIRLLILSRSNFNFNNYQRAINPLNPLPALLRDLADIENLN